MRNETLSCLPAHLLTEDPVTGLEADLDREELLLARDDEEGHEDDGEEGA